MRFMHCLLEKRDEESCEFAKYYIDAFQSVRNSIFNELLE